MLDIQTVSNDGNQVLTLIGELDIATVDTFKKTVAAAKQEGKGIILDMQHLSFVDSTGVGGLLTVIKGLSAEKVPIRMTNISSEVWEVFDLLGLPMLLGKEIFE